MDAPAGSELFESYVQDFNNIKESINKKLNTQIPSQTGEQRKATLRAAERETEEADEIVGQMDMEILNLPQSTRTRLQARLRGYKSELEKLKRELKKAQALPSNDRSELFGSHSDSNLSLDSTMQDQRTRLLAGTGRLQESSARLQDSHRVALEAESLGANILTTLQGQREQIIRSRDTLGEADGYIDRASRTLKEMSRRMATNRIVTIAIIIILVGLILLVIYSKLFG